MIAQNIENVRKRIEEVCLRCGRKPEEITLVAVSKTFGIEKVKEAVEAGVLDLGENYVQELTEKKGGLGDPNIRWHFIGHLQTNKVKYIAEYVHLIHTVDSERLGNELQKRGTKAGRTLNALVEVHTTDEATKYGVSPEKTVELVKKLSKFDRLKILGLMTMGPFADDPNDSRPSFQQLAYLKMHIEKEAIDNIQMKHLSMGMTHDFEVAIEEGATIVRIGTSIFGERKSTHEDVH